MFDLTDAKSTALHIAALNGHLPMVEHLVKSARFDVKEKNKVCMKTSSLMTFLVSFLHGYLYSVKYHTVPYMYYSPIIIHEWQQSWLTLEVFFCLSACNYKRPYLIMYVIIIG